MIRLSPDTIDGHVIRLNGTAPSAAHADDTAPTMDAGVGREKRIALLADMVRALSIACDADGATVAWHQPMHDPVLILSHGGAKRDGHGSDAIMTAAGVAIGNDWTVPQTKWHSFDSLYLMTIAMPIGDGAYGITMLFYRGGSMVRELALQSADRSIPLIEPFLRLWVLHDDVAADMVGLHSALDRSDVATLLLDRDGRLTFGNAAAERLLAEGDGLRRRGTMLSGGALGDTLRLQASIQHVVEGRMRQPGARQRSRRPGLPESRPAIAVGRVGGEPYCDRRDEPAPVIALRRHARRPLMVALLPVVGTDGRTIHAGATMLVFDPEQEFRFQIEPVCRLYGLSPVETKLTCLLTDGSSLAEAAANIRIREQTARSYLKQIFQKTDTNRQAELIWLMLRSSVRTSPDCTIAFA